MTFKCKGCERPFKTRSQMETHEKRCPRLRMGPLDSFSKILGKKHENTSNSKVPLSQKILPLSQPLDPPESPSPKVVDPDVEDFNIAKCNNPRDNIVPSSTNAEYSFTTGNGTIEIEQQQQNSTPTHPPESLNESVHDANCPTCRIDVLEGVDGLLCEKCYTWSHRECLLMPIDEYNALNASEDSWFCVTCLSMMANKIKWGEYHGEEAIKNKVSSIYNEIISWRKNLFMLPRGKAGTAFVKELTRLITLFTVPSKWNRVALGKLHVFIPLMLQKPSQKSKAKEHVNYLEKRLKLWSDGNLDAILSESREIQKRLKRSHEKKRESKEKAFCRLMLQGKVSQAMKFINSEDDTRGVHTLTDEIKQLLEEKHPKAGPKYEEVLIPPAADPPEVVIFEGINGMSVHKAAKQIQGSGGPTLIDADGWKHIICSKSYGSASEDLCEAIADLAKKLCRDDINPDTLTEFLANRLIPLDKGADKFGNPGVRPIGVGEILRRIVGKVIVGCIREDIIQAAGPLQTCAGLKSGIEASIHAMRKIFEREETEALLLVDAENAFNNLNRKNAIHNIRELCPPFFRFLSNTYQTPSRMIVNDQSNVECILSEEGSTQGDVAAMGMYAVGTRPLLDILHNQTDPTRCQQVWYADDSTAAGLLGEIRHWWDILNDAGPKFGYYPKPSKTILILKDPEKLELAKQLFDGTGIKLTLTGERHLGAVIGTQEFRDQYVSSKVQKWIEDIEILAGIAEDEPQLAYSSYTMAMCMRWCFVQRTIPNTKDHFVALEDTIRSKLIPAIVGRNVSDIERKIISLPVRYGGLGIQDPSETAEREFYNSTLVTQNLTSLIEKQETDLNNLDGDRIKEIAAQIKTEKEEYFMQKLEDIKSVLDEKRRRNLEFLNEKGSGVWLTALPLEAQKFSLSKQQFRDAIFDRYIWPMPGTPSYCACGVKNSPDHTLNCKLGGFVVMRHNNLRDYEATLLREVCRDVKVEPDLLPLGGSGTKSRNKAEKARPDVSAVGIWTPMERTFLDVRVTNPNSASYSDKSIEQIYETHENEKKQMYNDRILHVEKGSFTPLVFTTTGGMGPEATKYHKQVARLISAKRNEEYSDVVNWIRTKVRFALLKSTLIAIRGDRGRKKRETPIADISLNLIPECSSYEV